MAKRKSDSANRKPKQDGNLLDRQPPFSLEAETGVLGSVMLMPDACDDVVNIVRPEDFHDPGHAKLYAHIMEMHNAGKKIDLTLLRERLVAAGDFELVGGAAGLAEIFTSVPTAAHAVYYAEVVREKATLRDLIMTCTEILTTAYDPTSESETMLNAAEQKVFAIRESRQRSNLAAIDEVLQVAMDRLESRVRGEIQAGTVETGFTDLDRLTGGLHASELSILAARPSMGKTAFAMNIAENIVMRSGKPALFVSLEMAAIELIERMLCSVARVNGHRLRNGSLSADDRKRLINVTGELSRVRLYIDDSPTRNVSEIAATARRILRREGELGVIVIDYLQLIQPDDSRDPRQEQVAKMARRLKGLARELKVPILCLAQLNRQAEDTRDHRPRLSHLRESGAIEQDADVVMFVHRKDYYRSGDDDAEDNRGEALIIIAKQRNGPTDDVELTWLREFTRFEDRAADRFSEFDQYEPAPFQD